MLIPWAQLGDLSLGMEILVLMEVLAHLALQKHE